MKNLFWILFISLFATGCFAAEEGNVTYEPVNTALYWELLPDGSDWAKIYSSGEADLKFGDNRDIRMSSKKAVLRAKAELSKFFKEKISTEETLEDITKECLNAAAGAEGITEESTRKTVVTTIERIKNQSDAILRGVVTLETKVDKDNKLVVVKVGISRNSLAIADSVQSEINKKPGIKQTKPSASEKPSGTTIKRSPMYDTF